jgi:hypothetical protein
MDQVEGEVNFKKLTLINGSIGLQLLGYRQFTLTEQGFARI